VARGRRGVSGNPGFSRKEPEGLGCLILILTRACRDFPTIQIRKVSEISEIREITAAINKKNVNFHQINVIFIKNVPFVPYLN
jgi:hypothetical protein